MTFEEDKSITIWTGKDVLIIVIGTLVLFILGVIVLQLLTQVTGLDLMQNGNPTLVMAAGLGALEGIGFLGSIYLLGLRRRNLSWEAVGIRPTAGRWWLWGVLLGLLAIPLTGLVAALIQSALGQPMESPQIPFLAPSGFSWAGLISMLIMGGIVAPLAEELFFRGILYQWMRDRWGVRFGLLASALVFGAVHVDPAVAASAAVMGFILAWVYEQSQSIWPSITIHTINNGLKIIVLYISLATGLINLN